MPAHGDFDPDADAVPDPTVDPGPEAPAGGPPAGLPDAAMPAEQVLPDEPPSGGTATAAAPLAGAWLPPSTVQRPVTRLAAYPEPARPESITASRPTPSPFAPGPGAAAPAGSGGPPGRPGEASLLADLPLDAPSDLSGWLVLVGGGVGAVAFLLPWAPLVFEFYWDSWGLSSPVWFLAFLLVLATAILAIVPNRIGTWFRSGVLGLLSGGIGLGLTMPRIVEQDDVPFGVLVEVVAAILLVVGGAVAVAPRSSRGEASRD